MHGIIRYLNTIHRAEIALGTKEEEEAEEALDAEEVQ
jgi:hypothetical protein